MNRLATALLLLASTAPALAAEEGPDSATDKDRTRYEYAVRAVGGYFDGMGVRTDSGGVGIVELDLTPKLHVGEWAVELPLRLDHRQTFGADLNETIVGAELDALRRRGKVMRYGPVAGISYTWRPDWPDLYQRDDATGDLAPTDRYSHFTGYAGWQHWYRLGDGRNLRWKVRGIYTDYQADPGFDDADATPTHLVPRDNVQLRFDSSYRRIKDGWRYAVKLDAFYRWDLIAVAREAETGVVTDELQRQWRLEPSAELGLTLGAVELSVDYTWLKHVDAVTGYYSYTGHNPGVKAELALGKRLSLHARADAWFLTGGPDSKSNTEDGKRLEYTKYVVKGGARYAMTKALAAVADVEWKTRDTNYPDYTAPGPVIAWDYTNVMATAGVEWKP